MKTRSLRYVGAVLCLLYTGQAAAVPVFHILDHSASGVAAAAICEDGGCRQADVPVLKDACAGSCSRPEHHHHPHERHHGPTTCPVCSGNLTPGICQKAPFPPSPSDGAPISGGVAEIALTADHPDNTSPRAPPILL